MVWRQALADVLDRRPGAVRAAVSLMQRASALDGLDAPTHEVLRTPAYAEIARWAAQMQERMRSEIVIEADILDEKE
jgi:hypothetical protein